MTTSTKEATVVRSFEPSRTFHRMMRIGNAFIRPLLRSSAGKGIREVALLCFDGRRTGRRYEIPVAYHELDGDPLILTASRWRVNLRGGADVELVHEGHRVPMRAELIEDADEVARIYERLLHRDGLENAKPTKIGLKVDGDRMPTCEEIATAVDGRRAVVGFGRGEDRALDPIDRVAFVGEPLLQPLPMQLEEAPGDRRIAAPGRRGSPPEASLPPEDPPRARPAHSRRSVALGVSIQPSPIANSRMPAGAPITVSISMPPVTNRIEPNTMPLRLGNSGPTHPPSPSRLVCISHHPSGHVTEKRPPA